MGVEEREDHRTADHVPRNRAAWDVFSRHYFELGRRGWQEEARWGIWGIPEERLRLLPDVAGQDAIELGCGTGYLSGWLARRGARAVGVDVSSEQLRTASAFQKEFRNSF